MAKDIGVQGRFEWLSTRNDQNVWIRTRLLENLERHGAQCEGFAQAIPNSFDFHFHFLGDFVDGQYLNYHQTDGQKLE